MNRSLAALAASVLLLQAAPATARESLPARAFSALGHAVAQQGNQALRDIREEMRERLQRELKPALPAPARPPVPQRPQR